MISYRFWRPVGTMDSAHAGMDALSAAFQFFPAFSGAHIGYDSVFQKFVALHVGEPFGNRLSVIIDHARLVVGHENSDARMKGNDQAARAWSR